MDRTDEVLIEEAMDYLVSGGLGEVLGLATNANEHGLAKVQIDTDLMIALCMLAQDGLIKRKVH